MDYLAILIAALKGNEELSGVIYKAQRKAEINEFIYRNEFYDKIKLLLKSIETNQTENTGIQQQDIINLKNAISEAECMFDPYFTLSGIILYDLEDVKRDLLTIEKKEQQINFIDNLITQSGVDRFIKLWNEDCSICSIQFAKKPAWEGVIDSCLGKVQKDKMIEKSAYLAGVEHYNCYLNLKLLREQINNKKFAIINHKHKSFDSKLTEQHIEELVCCINKFKMFESKVDTNQMIAFFNCKLETPIKLNNNKIATTFFNLLRLKEWICEEWQSVIEANSLLQGKRGKILESNNLSSALSKENRSTEYYLLFDEVIRGLK